MMSRISCLSQRTKDALAVSGTVAVATFVGVTATLADPQYMHLAAPSVALTAVVAAGGPAVLGAVAEALWHRLRRAKGTHTTTTTQSREEYNA